MPPNSVNGVANSNEINIQLLNETFDIKIIQEIVDLTFHKKFNTRKILQFLYNQKKIACLSKRNNFDFFYIVFSASTAGSIKTLISILLFRMFNISSTCIVHVHRGDLNSFVSKKKINELLFLLVLRTAHRLIVLSEQTNNYVNKQFRVDNKVFVLSNTINHESFPRIDRKEKVNNKNKVFRFIYISNYIEEKGILLLLNSFKKLGEQFYLSCFGNFSDKNLRDLILSHSSDRIKINDSINGDEKFIAMQEADALILPSFNEGQPVILLEAMCSGVPFIVPDVGYIREMVFPDYPFIYGENNENNLLSMIDQFSICSELDKLKLQQSLMKHYFDNYSNLIHREKLYRIFN